MTDYFIIANAKREQVPVGAIAARGHFEGVDEPNYVIPVTDREIGRPIVEAMRAELRRLAFSIGEQSILHIEAKDEATFIVPSNPNEQSKYVGRARIVYHKPVGAHTALGNGKYLVAI